LQPVQWIFTLFATPDPTYLWLNPKGGELDYAQLEKYEMDVNVKTGKVKLVKTLENFNSPISTINLSPSKSKT
jgi:hypothetical protein